MAMELLSSRGARKVLIAGSFLLWTGCSSPLTTVPPELDIPVRIKNHLPTAQVNVNGKPLSLFLDLGGFSALALTRHEIEITGVSGTVVAMTTFHDPFENSSTSREFIAHDIRVAGRQIGPLRVTESVLGPNAPPERNGYVGMGFLSQHTIVIDYVGGSVRLYKKSHRSVLEQECGGATFDITIANGIAQSVVQTELGPLVALWDTGSTDNVIRTSILEQRDLVAKVIDDGPPSFCLQTLGLPSVSVGPTQFRSLPFKAPDVDLVLGTPFFLANRVCLDLVNGKGAVRQVVPLLNLATRCEDAPAT